MPPNRDAGTLCTFLASIRSKSLFFRDNINILGSILFTSIKLIANEIANNKIFIKKLNCSCVVSVQFYLAKISK